MTHRQTFAVHSMYSMLQHNGTVTLTEERRRDLGLTVSQILRELGLNEYVTFEAGKNKAYTFRK